MKKIMIAALGLSLLSSTALFAQNTSGQTSTDTSGNTMSSKKTKHKHKKGTAGTSDTSGTTSSTSK
jgi:hypothetical protein